MRQLSEIENAVRLLVVDDSPVERLALGHFLRVNGFNVSEAADGSSAISHLKNAEISAVLLDLSMPGSDGFEVLKYIQAHRRSLPVILLSGMPIDQIQHKMSDLPTPELPPLLIKPVDPDQLIEVLELKLSGALDEPNDQLSADEEILPPG